MLRKQKSLSSIEKGRTSVRASADTRIGNRHFLHVTRVAYLENGRRSPRNLGIRYANWRCELAINLEQT